MNWLAKISPKWAFKRAQYNAALAAYEAAKPGRLRKTGADNSSGDTVVSRAGANLRGYARQLDQNHDVARGVLNTLVNNIVGPNGISIDPEVKDNEGNIHEEFSAELMALYSDWKLKPEVTHEHDLCAAERLACRTWIRDGELLSQFLEGSIPTLDHGTQVPLSIELIEADHLPISLHNETKNITQGVERNSWGRPIAYHIYKQHPGDMRSTFSLDTKRVSADRMIHMKLVDRIKQARGVSIFAAVMRRLEDLKDYEESERIAARVAAAMTAYIKKGTSDLYQAPDGTDEQRNFKLSPGMVFDRLQAGEEIGTVQSNRPSVLLEPFRNAMMKAVAAGTGANYSSVAKDYDGSYSSQRQELVEGWRDYESLTGLWVGQFSRPTWRRFVEMAIVSGRVRIPANVDRKTLYDADFRGPAMPWIDPDKEAKARERLERAGYKSAQQNIRDIGGNPEGVRKQIKTWRDKNDQDELIFTTDAKHEIDNSQQDTTSESSQQDSNG